MIDSIKSRWLLFLVIAVFVVCKIPHLCYPYYWDEGWPYATAIKSMCDQGISLMPAALDPELSRGHPLFFHALAASWMRVFGSSHIAMHSFALCIAMLFLIAIYEAGLRLFNTRVASLALLLVATQVFFFVQSSFVLLELLVAFLCFLSICFYSTGRYLLVGISLSMLFFTKESGMVLGLVLGTAAFVGLFSNTVDRSSKWRALASVCIPFILISVFFLIQKQVRGWYIFPLHLEKMEYGWSAFWYKFRMACLRDAFYQSYKFFYFLLLLVLAGIAAVKNKKLTYLVILLPACCIYYFVNDTRAGRLLPPIPFFITFLLSVSYFLYAYTRPVFFGKGYQRTFIILSGGFIICFLCFSTLNFYTYRYLQAAVIPLLFLLAIFADMLITHSYRILYYPAVAIMLLVSFCSFRYNSGYGDMDLGAYKAMDLHQDVVNYMESEKAYTAHIATGAYMQSVHLTDPVTGYLHSGRKFTDLKWTIDGQTVYVIFDNIELDYRYTNEFNKDSLFVLVHRCSIGEKWAEVYKRKTPAHN